MRVQIIVMHFLLLCAVAVPLTRHGGTNKSAPHIFFVLVDDLGSADVGFTRNGGFKPATQPEVRIINTIYAHTLCLFKRINWSNHKSYFRCRHRLSTVLQQRVYYSCGTTYITCVPRPVRPCRQVGSQFTYSCLSEIPTNPLRGFRET